ncbi:hypothetical protein [Methylopila sp. M107]|uniref:hypothetical protein n=1 Tax=Methylopila sp. M107 TaxID=1101190 RepID=UPI0003A08ED1|nr:hypothetical protein [Methylopila sp. M107]
MRTALTKLLIIAPFALMLAACAGAPGILPQNEPAHISKVQVSLAPNVSSQRFATSLQTRTMQYAARFGRAGAAKELRIVVERHSYKNAAMSLLVGDANVAMGRVAVIDVASDKVQGEAQAGAIDTLAINGIAGAIIAAAQDKEKVDQRLVEGFAKAALRHAYGAARAEPFLDQPEPSAGVAEPEKPDAAPAPAKKDVPLASAEKRRTAMAGSTPAVAR